MHFKKKKCPRLIVCEHCIVQGREILNSKSCHGYSVGHTLQVQIFSTIMLLPISLSHWREKWCKIFIITVKSRAQ